MLSNDEGDAESSAKLTVNLPRIQITKSLKDQTINAGEKVLLSVEVNTSPKSVKWLVNCYSKRSSNIIVFFIVQTQAVSLFTFRYKNGKEIGSNHKAKPRKVNDNSYQLEICDATEDDASDYKVCIDTFLSNTGEMT